VSFKRYFEEKFAFTGSKKLSKSLDLTWQEVQTGIWLCGFAYNASTQTVESSPESLGDLPDEYFVSHDLYTITLQDINASNSFDDPLIGFRKKYSNLLKKKENYFWISFESYEWGSRNSSATSGIVRNPKLILQTVISAIDKKLKPTDNICFSADVNDRSRNLLYARLSNQYAKQVGKQTIKQQDGDENVYLVH